MQLIGLASLLVGCDPFNGVTRTYQLESSVEFHCVESVLAEHPMISEYRYEVRDGNQPILLWLEPDRSHWFYYRLTNTDAWNGLRFLVKRKGAVTYWHNFGCIACFPPQELVDIYRPFMKDVETRLEQSCRATGLSQGVVETCTVVTCNEL